MQDIRETYYAKYIEYIKNSGENLKVEWFDEYWEPIGPMVRKDMKQAGLIYEKDGKIFLSSRYS